MNFNNFTIKAQEAVQQAQIEAQERNHLAVEVAHLYSAIQKEVLNKLSKMILSGQISSNQKIIGVMQEGELTFNMAN